MTEEQVESDFTCWVSAALFVYLVIYQQDGGKNNPYQHIYESVNIQTKHNNWSEFTPKMSTGL